MYFAHKYASVFNSSFKVRLRLYPFLVLYISIEVNSQYNAYNYIPVILGNFSFSGDFGVISGSWLVSISCSYNVGVFFKEYFLGREASVDRKLESAGVDDRDEPTWKLGSVEDDFDSDSREPARKIIPHIVKTVLKV